MERKNNLILTAFGIPLSIVYGLVVFIRNQLFNLGILASRQFHIPVISVGNISVGGTGKTPHVEHIVSFLKDEFRVAVLSRGYKRKSNGFVVASTASGTDNVGDEPLQIKKKFPSIEVAVDGDRVRGIRKLCSYNNKLQAIILDDAFQHRWVKPGISILLIDYNRPVKDDWLLPAGRLREPFSSRKRAPVVIVTKCPPGIKPIERRIISKELDLFPWQSLYFTTFAYGEPLPVFSDNGLNGPGKVFGSVRPHVLMVTGIASPSQLRHHLEQASSGISECRFPDHHRFTMKDVKRIQKKLQSIDKREKVIITTEKDAVRFLNLRNIDPGMKSKMYYIPVFIRFIEDEEKLFRNQILQYVRNNKRDHIIY